jgi:A nuclease of the HNH/ENDO VII superfamily with conserved WHH
MTRPGQTVEQITVPLGDPDALVAAAGSLKGVAAQLQDASSQVGASPSLMSSWSGPGSSQFALLTGEEAVSLQSASSSVLMAGISVQIGADQLEQAQRRAQRAIVRAQRARDDINDAKEAIREAVQAQRDAQGRMDAAMLAREAAEFQLFATAVDSLLGSGAAEQAIAAADAAYREAERDLQEAQRREVRARDRLKEAVDDLEQAREDGREAAEDAETAAIGLRFALAGLPTGVLAMPGMPAQAQISHAAGIRQVEPRRIPISEQEPPEHWPGFAKSLFKIGRGEATVIAGTLGLAKSAYENPEKIPGAVKDFGVRAYDDPLGTGKQLVGYDLLAAGKWEDWLGGAGVSVFMGGAGTAPARASRFNRVVGSPHPVPLGRMSAPINSRKFAGTRFDFTKPDLGMRAGRWDPPKISEADRLALAEKYPKGVRFTRDGYPVFTPYEIDRVRIANLTGDREIDADLANLARNRTETPAGYVWHHVEDGRTMELVPRDLHEAVRHTGGAADIGQARALGIRPGGVFTPFEQDLNDFGAVGGASTAVAGAQEGRP